MHHPRQTHRPRPHSAQNISGVIQRAIHAAIHYRCLNPARTAKYGTAEESVSLDPDDPGKLYGISSSALSF
jgi:hypothetical protein